MTVVLPAQHRKPPLRRTPTTLGELARATWHRPSGRELVFSTIPFRRVLEAWLAVAIAVRLNAVLAGAVLAPVFGGPAAEVLSTLLTIASVLAVTQPLFRSYAEQFAGTLAWYGFVLAGLTVISEGLVALKLEHRFMYEVLARYDVFNGALWPFVVLAIACTPFIWTRRSQS